MSKIISRKMTDCDFPPGFSHVSLEKLVSLVFPEISFRAFSEEASSEVKQEAYSCLHFTGKFVYTAS